VLEIKAMMANLKGIELVSCLDLVGLSDVEETGKTLEENAILKAKTYYSATGIPCFSDDSGLEVSALNGAPGIYSARYAGENVSWEANINKLLGELQVVTDRKACFRTVVAFVENEKDVVTFEGRLEGKITMQRVGNKGFGYDPIFILDGMDKTLAELSLEQKNNISHRGRAIEKLCAYLSP